MLRYDVLEHVPDLGAHALYHSLRLTYIVRYLVFYELLHNERLKQLERHLFGKSALVDLKLGAYDDNRTSGIVYALTQKVLTETSLLTLEHIGKRL